VLVDFTDGTLARALRVKERMPLISGEVIDYIHDLLGLTFAPMFFLHRAGLLPGAWGFAIVVAATLAATLKYGMKANLLTLGYSLGAPPIFAGLLLFWFLDLGPAATMAAASALTVLVLLPFRFPITSLVTTHWKPGWQSVTNWLVFLAAPWVLVSLRDAPRALYWALLANLAVQLTVFPLLLRAGVLRPGFRRAW
jgi:phosphatidylcholine synthase